MATHFDATAAGGVSRAVNERAHVDSNIPQLVVVGGPSCVGKSTLLDRLARGEMPCLAESIGLSGAPELTIVHAAELKTRRQWPAAGPVLLHYELTRTRFLQGWAAADNALALLRRANRLDFLTLWEQPDEMHRRFEAKFKNAIVADLRRLRLGRASRVLRRYRLRRPYFVDRDKMWKLYCQWFEVCDAFEASRHWVFRSGELDCRPELLHRVKNSRFPPWEGKRPPSGW